MRKAAYAASNLDPHLLEFHMDTLRQLADSLPAIHDGVVLTGDVPDALVVIDQVPDGYIWPELVDWFMEPGARTVLIEAPGAVGKSVAAAALAATLNWPLVDASKAQVGSYSLSGLIQDALGFNSPFIGQIMGGLAGVIVDALDEAHLKAGTVNFLEFLENIRKIAGRPTDGPPSVVLFSRPDTADIVRAFFSVKETPVSRGRIGFFDFAQAQDFVYSYMSRQNEKYPGRYYDAPTKHPIPFERLLLRRMNEIAATLLAQEGAIAQESWSGVKEFIGYAPVLSVLSEFLAVPNPFAETRAISAPPGRARSILLKIISDLLQREQDKFQTQVGTRLRAELPADIEWGGFADIYSPDEQRVRLVEKMLELHFTVPIPASMPAAIRESYDRDARQFTSDHPFLAGTGAVNIVFSDFIKACAAVDRTCSLSLNPDPRRAVDRVGPFFYQFVHEFARDDKPNIASVPEGLIAVLVESHAHSAPSNHENRFTFLQHESQASLAVRDTLGQSDDYLDFTITELSGAVHLPAQMMYGVLTTDAGVILGVKGQRFILGPDATVNAKEIVLEAEILSIDPGPDHLFRSVLSSDKIVVTGRLSVESFRPNSFAVQCEDIVPALRPYLDLTSTRQADYRGFVDLRAIILAFRRVLGEDPGVFGELLEQRIVKGDPVRQHYLARLLELELVYLSESHYYLNTTRFGAHGVTFSDMSKGKTSPKIGEFLTLLDSD